MQEEHLDESTDSDITHQRVIREAIKAASNLMAADDPVIASKLSGALSLLAIAASIPERRLNIRILNAATNLIQKSI